MDPEPSPWKTAHVHLATHGQTREKVNEIVATMLGRAGCHTCGRVLRLDLEFAVDPGPELAKNGAISFVAGGG